MGLKCWLNGHDYIDSCDRCSQCGEPESGGHEWYAAAQYSAHHQCRRCRQTKNTLEIWSTCDCNYCEMLRTAPIDWFVALLSKDTEADYGWSSFRGTYTFQGDPDEKPVALAVLEKRLQLEAAQLEGHDLWKIMNIESTSIFVERAYNIEVSDVERHEIRTDTVNAMARDELTARFGEMPSVEQVTPYFGEAVTFYSAPALARPSVAILKGLPSPQSPLVEGEKELLESKLTGFVIDGIGISECLSLLSPGGSSLYLYKWDERPGQTRLVYVNMNDGSFTNVILGTPLYGFLFYGEYLLFAKSAEDNRDPSAMTCCCLLQGIEQSIPAEDVTPQCSMAEWVWFSRKPLDYRLSLPDGESVDREYAAARADGITCVVYSTKTRCWPVVGHPDAFFVLFAHESKDPSFKFDKETKDAMSVYRDAPRWYEIVYTEPDLIEGSRQIILTESATKVYDEFRFEGTELLATEYAITDSGEVPPKTVSIDLSAFD